MPPSRPAPPVFPTPPTVLLDSFLIETYPSIEQTPYASLPLPSHHPPPDALQNRCRICLHPPASNPHLVCHKCSRLYHINCLSPSPPSPPPRIWTCPTCVRNQNYRHHIRATAVAALRNVIRDIQERPRLPPKLRLKMLDLPPPSVRVRRGERDGNSGEVREWTGSRVPPKRRIRKRSGDEMAMSGTEKGSWSKSVRGESVRRRRDHIVGLAAEVKEAAKERQGGERLVRKMDKISERMKLERTRDAEGVGETRTSDNGATQDRKEEPKMEDMVPLRKKCSFRDTSH